MSWGGFLQVLLPMKWRISFFYTPKHQGTVHRKGVSKTVRLLATISYSFLCLQIYMIMLMVGELYKLLLAKWAFILHEDFLFYNQIFSQLKIPLPYYRLPYFLGEMADPVILFQFFVPSFKYLMLFWLWKPGDSHHSMVCLAHTRH